MSSQNKSPPGGSSDSSAFGRPTLEELRAARDTPRSRRAFLKVLGSTAAGAAAVAACGPAAELTLDEFLQKHYKRLSDDEKREIFARLEAKALERYGVEVSIKDPKPIAGVEFAYALNLSFCVGCRRCEDACATENNTSRDPQVHYIRVLEMEKGSFDVERATTDYSGIVPKPGKFYMPVQCHQCRNPPCVKACPVRATWKEPDGIVVVDYDWCIGCRYCEAACPYFARRFNWTDPKIPSEQVNPNQGYLSNRIRPRGVMEKCTFCLHRTREGRYPACLEACPTGARKFGNLLDPESEVRKVIETKRVYVLKEEVGTLPRFYYFFG
ncbi:MAG: 4Fe-4S dicluster domain-containing protein [Deltaproteobacteria bacterium]|nr:4Fe-4S dicluster domain-containing protein [Deltaproteobacteria bacterium]